MGPNPWTEPEEAPHGPSVLRRPLLLATIAVPWILAALLLVHGTDDPPTDSTASDGGRAEPGEGAPGADLAGTPGQSGDPLGAAGGAPGATEAAPSPPPAHPGQAGREGQAGRPDQQAVPGPSGDHDQPGSVASGALELWELRGNWRVEPGLGAAAALAVAVARDALTGRGPSLDLSDAPALHPDGYAEHLVVEAVERTTAEAAAATVLAVVLEGDPLTARIRRIVVPLSLRDGIPRPAGVPWELPGPDTRPVEGLEGAPLDDPDLRQRAEGALERAGLDGLEVTGLLAADEGTLVAEVRDTATADLATIWLRRHVDGLVVVGTPLDDDHREALP